MTQQNHHALEEAVVALLDEKKMTISTAESCTGGLIAKRLTDLAGVSSVFLGGVVAYANDAKIKLLGVSPDTLAAHGAVSEKVAAEMARGVRLATGADIAVSTTGIAGPGGGTPAKPVGTVWTAISTADGERTHLLSLPPTANRDTIRKETVRLLLTDLLELLRA